MHTSLDGGFSPGERNTGDIDASANCGVEGLSAQAT